MTQLHISMTMQLLFTAFILLAASVVGFAPSQGQSSYLDSLDRNHKEVFPRSFPGGTRMFQKSEQEKDEFVERSVNYYYKVMREDRRRELGQSPKDYQPQEDEEYVQLAMRHYFAIRKVKDGKLGQAESIYRRIINELSQEEKDGHCDHSKLAVTTLLLALLMQRKGDVMGARHVFREFFRKVVTENDEQTECACSAKVLQAYALMEMNNGLPQKSLHLVQKALEFDPSLSGILRWKQFRDVLEKASQRAQRAQRRTPAIPQC